MYRGFRPFSLTTMVFLRDCSSGTWFCVFSPGDGVELTKVHIFTNIKSYQSEHSMHIEHSLLKLWDLCTFWHLDICICTMSFATSVLTSGHPFICLSVYQNLLTSGSHQGLVCEVHQTDMDQKDPDITEGDNLWLPAHTDYIQLEERCIVGC